MKLRLERLWPKKDYTVGRLYVDDRLFCNTLEDRIVDKNKNGVFDIVNPLFRMEHIKSFIIGLQNSEEISQDC